MPYFIVYEPEPSKRFLLRSSKTAPPSASRGFDKLWRVQLRLREIGPSIAAKCRVMMFRHEDEARHFLTADKEKPAEAGLH